MISAVKKKKLPTFWYERRLWRRGYKLVVGLDEVGRGAWAGPLVVGAAAFLPRRNGSLRSLESSGIDDSKRVLPERRVVLSRMIKKEALVWSVAEVSVGEINRLGMGKATQKGFRRAVKLVREKISKGVDYVLVDAFYVSRLAGLPRTRTSKSNQRKGALRVLGGKGRQLAIVEGDRKSISIAAASIVAKVYRDGLMQKMADKYTKYGWKENVGYGTARHKKAIEAYGVTKWHRKKFVEKGMRKSA